MVGYKARTALMRTARLNWAVSVVLVVWHVVDGRDPDGTLIALFLVLAVAGTLIGAIRHHAEGTPIEQAIDKLIEALVASRPVGDREPLRLVDQKENGSTIPAQRRSVL